MELKLEGGLSTLYKAATKGASDWADQSTQKTHDLSDLVDATEEDIKKSKELTKFVKQFNRIKAGMTIQCDRKKKKILVTFSATKVPKNLVNKIADKSGEFYDLVTNYDTETKMVEMVFDAPDLPQVANPKTNKSGETPQSRIGTGQRKRKESVMAPTPTPYKLELKSKDSEELKEGWYDDDEEDSEYELVDRKSVRDSDGFMTDYSWYMNFEGSSVFVFGDSDLYRLEDGEFDHEEDDPEAAQEWFDNYHGFGDDEDDIFESFLNETDGLDTSSLVRKINDNGEDSIEMDINNRVYSFTMKEDSPYTIDQMFHKVSKMRHYSEGRALAFMKKNMVGKRVESLRESKYAVQYYNGRLGRWITAQTYRDEESATKDLPFHKKMFGAPGQGPLKDYEIKVVKLKESGNPFKDKHKCQGCGKPLSQCTCEIEDEESVEEALTEAVVPETYKTIKIELHDPDSQLENLIKCIKAASDPGHSFTVRVDSESSDYYKEFWIDGDGSFRITSIEVKDEVEDVEVEESLLRESYEYFPETSVQIARSAISRAVSEVGGKLVRKRDGRVSYQADDLDTFDKGREVIRKFVMDAHNESFDGSSATQPSSIGQHKRGKIDMFPKDKEEEV